MRRQSAPGIPRCQSTWVWRELVHLSDMSPVDDAPLIGRARELDELERLAREHRLVTVVGPGGLGKTRLAAEISRRIGSEEAVWVDLSPVTDGTGLTSAVAYALGVAETDERDLTTVVRERLGSAPALLAAAGAAAEFARRGVAWEPDGLFSELGPLDGHADGLSFDEVVVRTQLALESIAPSSSDGGEVPRSD